MHRTAGRPASSDGWVKLHINWHHAESWKHFNSKQRPHSAAEALFAAIKRLNPSKPPPERETPKESKGGRVLLLPLNQVCETEHPETGSASQARRVCRLGPNTPHIISRHPASADSKHRFYKPNVQDPAKNSQTAVLAAARASWRSR